MPELSGRTKLLAIIGDPVAHVRAPAFFAPVFARLGLDAVLVPFHLRPADLADVVPRLAKLANLHGLIVTIPHKETIARLCDELGPDGRLTGAVNTVRFDPAGRLAGDMFDGFGLVEACRTNGVAVDGRSFLLLGAGGAGRAIAFALPAAGAAAVTIWNRSPERARGLADAVARAFPSCRVSATPDVDGSGHDVVVNCTSLGLHEGDPMPMDPATLAPSSAYVDIIAPRDTELMAAASERGCRVVGGRPMAELQVEAQLGFLGLTGVG